MIPSRAICGTCAWRPNASRARSASLYDASSPSTSLAGSASAKPWRCASFRTSAYARPVSSISVRMKLQVPFRIPATETTRSPAKLSRSARRIGIPPATAASMPRPTALARARAWSAAPSFARRSLFAVTTLFPAPSAARMSAFAGSSPPISSTTTSTSGAVATESRSADQRDLAELGVARARPTARRHGREAHVDAAAGREIRRARGEQARERAPDVPVAEKPHAHERAAIAFHAPAMYGTAPPRSKTLSEAPDVVHPRPRHSPRPEPRLAARAPRERHHRDRVRAREGRRQGQGEEGPEGE